MKTIAFTSFGTLCLGLSAGLWVAGSSSVDPIFRTRGVEVVDAQGKTRVRIGENPRNGLPGVYLYSDDGNLLGELAVEGGKSPFLLFKSKEGRWSAQFVMDEHGDGSWQFYSPRDEGQQASEVVRAAIGVGPQPVMDAGPSERAGFMLVLGKDGTPKATK